jgi:hypothetical protein
MKKIGYRMAIRLTNIAEPRRKKKLAIVGKLANSRDARKFLNIKI